MNNKDILYNFGEGLKKQIIDNHLKAGQRATGDTIQSFEVEANETDMFLYGPKYVEDLEKGVRPGTKPKISDLERWIVAKFNTPKFNVNQFATYLSQKIYKKGSFLYRTGGRVDIFSNVLTEENIGVLTPVMQDKYADLIQEQIVSSFK